MGFSFEFLFFSSCKEELPVGENRHDGLLGGGPFGEGVRDLLGSGDPGQRCDVTPVHNLFHSADVFDDQRRLACVLGGEDGGHDMVVVTEHLDVDELLGNVGDYKVCKYEPAL